MMFFKLKGMVCFFPVSFGVVACLYLVRILPPNINLMVIFDCNLEDLFFSYTTSQDWDPENALLGLEE